MRVGSYSTGILPFRHREQRRFCGIPRVQPRNLTLLTPTSNAKSRNTYDLEIARELYSGMGVRASQARELVIEGDQPTAVTRVAGLSHWAIYRPPGGG